MQELPIIRTSERRTFKECQQKWWWAWRMGLKSKHEDQTALWFGSLIHDCLEQHYCGPGLKRGPHPADTFEALVKGIDDEYYINTGTRESEKWINAVELGVAMLEGYIEEYGDDETWSIVAPERSFQINIPHFKRNKDGTHPILGIYAGTFDLVYFDLETEMYMLGEHKTAMKPGVGHLSLDDQAGSYWLIAPRILEAEGLLKKGDVIGGITYNFLQKKMPDSRPVNDQGKSLNKNGSVSKIQPTSRYLRHVVERSQAERRVQLSRIQNELAWMDVARRIPDRITKNPTYMCERFCQFHSMCEMHEKGGDDWKQLKRAMYKVRDPYADHRKSTEE
jgi:hypothetical protein